MSIIATLGEFILGVLLIIDYRIKEAGIGAGILTLGFGLSMAIFLGIRTPFDYPAFVLSGLDHFEWSIDNYVRKRSL